jgi:hypothetical protein
MNPYKLKKKITFVIYSFWGAPWVGNRLGQALTGLSLTYDFSSSLSLT